MTLKRATASRRLKKSRSSSVTNSLSLPQSHYLLFGGKGGVGKTTTAAATALRLLTQAKANETMLLLSTDPAHSLSDSLQIKVGNRIVQIARRGNAKLLAYELDASLALERFRTKHRSVLAQIAERGTFLDEKDINDLLDLSLPGLDEVMSLFELTELERAGDYSRVLIDTAPSGHTTRMLRLPDVLKRMVASMDHMADKHRYIIAHFGRRQTRTDEVDQFLDELTQRISTVKSLLFDEQKSSFVLVTLPEAMSVFETKRYFEFLKAEEVPVKHLVINRIEQEHPGCGFCRSRVKGQRKWLKELAGEFEELDIRRLPLMSGEVRGLKQLAAVGKQIWSSGNERKTGPTSASEPGRSSKTRAPTRNSGFQTEQNRLTIFGGKGGVGKTTAASAYGLALAERHPDRRVLIFSTDPAHSLSDSFDEKVGNFKKRVAGRKNLDAIELDASVWFENFRDRYRSWIDELFASLSGGSRLEIKFDREAMKGLMDLTPPGIDEIAALSTMTDLVEENRYDAIIVDSAPTGHLIRLLELPQIALTWVRTFMKLLLKYQGAVHANQLAEELVSLSKGMKQFLNLLTDKSRCEFVAVAIPEHMSLEETIDLRKSLTGLNVPIRRLLINNMIPVDAAVSCSFCRARRRLQDSVVSSFRKRLGKSIRIYLSAQQPDEVNGKLKLSSHFASWELLQEVTVSRTERAKK